MKPIHYVVGVLVLIITVLLLLWPSYEPPDTTVWKREIAAQNKQIAVLSAELQKKAEKFKSDSLRLAKDSVEHKKHVSKLERTVRDLKANPRVVYIREQEPSVDSLITAQDSLIVRSVQRVAALEGEMFALRQDMSKVFTDCEARFQAQLEKEKLTEAENERLAKEVKKGRRSKKLFQALSVLGPVAVVLIAL